MLIVLFSICSSINSIYLGKENFFKTLDIPSEGEVLHSQGANSNSLKFIYFYNLRATDHVYRCTSWPSSTLPGTECTEDTNVHTTNFVYGSTEIYAVQQSETHQLQIRGGFTDVDQCPTTTYFMSGNDFDLDNLMAAKSITPPSQFCVIMFNQATNANIQNNLAEGDELKIFTGGYYKTINPGDTENFETTESPVYLSFRLAASSRLRNIQFSLSGVTATSPTNFLTTDVDLKNGIPPATVTPSSSSSSSSPASEPTEDPSPPSSTSESSSSSSSSSSVEPEQPSSESIITSSSIVSESETTTLEATPDATWMGDWEDPPNVIIRGDDIPEIKETYPPLQTEYVKTEVPMVTKAVTISTGTILIIVIVVLTVINIFRSYRRIKTHAEEFGTDEVSDLSDSFMIYSDSYNAS